MCEVTKVCVWLFAFVCERSPNPLSGAPVGSEELHEYPGLKRTRRFLIFLRFFNLLVWPKWSEKLVLSVWVSAPRYSQGYISGRRYFILMKAHFRILSRLQVLEMIGPNHFITLVLQGYL